MENSQIIALVAIGISLFSLGLSFVVPISLQSDIRDLNDKLIEQSQTIKSLNAQLNGNTQLIKTQNSIINDLETHLNTSQTQINSLQTNVINLENQINSLDNRVTSLEQKVNQLPINPTPAPAFFPNAVGFYDTAGGGGQDDNRVFKQLSSTLPNIWTVDFDYKFTASTIPDAYPLALTTSNANPEQQGTGNAILIMHGDNSDILHIRTWYGHTVVDSPTIYTGIQIFPNTQYYIRLEKTSTQLELFVFSDSARRIQLPGSPIIQSITPEFGNLNFIQHSTSLSSSAGRTLTAELTNTKIYVNETSSSENILFQDDYRSKDGWTQIGTSIIINGPAVQHPLPYGIIGAP